MKGYLQRLVQTVTSPAESVHPWTASVFDAGYQRDFDNVPSGELAPPAADVQSHQNSAQSSPALAPTQTLLPAAECKSPTSGLKTTQGSTQSEQSANRGPSFNRRIIPEPLIAGIDIANAMRLEIVPAKSSERATTPHGYTPVVTAEAVIKSGNAVEPAVSSSRTAAHKRDAHIERNSAAINRQADEIQIHIGRIEVTAVHPPPPKAPKMRDKEISLDAYLKRRDGRAG
jgi:hypothetical protein